MYNVQKGYVQYCTYKAMKAGKGLEEMAGGLTGVWSEDSLRECMQREIRLKKCKGLFIP